VVHFAPHHKCSRRRLIEWWNLRERELPAIDVTRESPVLFAQLLLACALLFTGCHTSFSSGPSIEFTKVPPASSGGPDKLATIEGRVEGARPGQGIVLYAKSGMWWVQPFVDKPVTPIGADSRWSNSTHLGTEYAALLVQPGYHAPAKILTLPSVGDGVVLISTAKGEPGPPELARTVHFSGYDWNVRATASERGGRVNSYSPDNVWIDSNSALHLRIAKKGGKWSCAEVTLARTLGYGLYRFTLQNTSTLEPAVALDLFTWDDSGADPNHRELDVEISRWGDPRSKDAQYVVQPYYVAANVDRFSAPAGTLTHSFRWEPGKVTFRTVQDSKDRKEGRMVAEHVFTSAVPSPGDESVHMAFYVFGSAQDPVGDKSEVVVDKFEYLP
jgi:hypothetical protein